jgi:chromatin remodeling complex protein RSC6
MATEPKTAKATSGLMKPLKPSAELAAVIGAGDVSRGEAVKKIWEYIKKHDLQDAKDKRQINADAKLQPVFDGNKSLSMFEMNKHLAKHLKG